MAFDKEFHLYVETRFLLLFDIVSAYYYNNELDGMCDCHSIWRRWGQYRKRIIEYGLFYEV